MKQWIDVNWPESQWAAVRPLIECVGTGEKIYSLTSTATKFLALGRYGGPFPLPCPQRRALCWLHRKSSLLKNKKKKKKRKREKNSVRKPPTSANGTTSFIRWMWDSSVKREYNLQWTHRTQTHLKNKSCPVFFCCWKRASDRHGYIPPF